MARHVLVPVDGSAPSESAFEYAIEEFPDARLTLLHVVNPTSSFGYGDDEYFDFEGMQAHARQQHERGEELLTEYREAATNRDVETRLATGRPARAILEAAEADDVDHIVMGSHGRSGAGRVLFGSVAETVTRRASVPVTILH